MSSSLPTNIDLVGQFKQVLEETAMSQKQRYQLGGLGIVLVGMLLLVGVHFVWQEPARVMAQSNDEEPNSMIQSYADTIGISYEEAKRRLEIQAEMDELESKVIEGEPTYAGSWTLHQPDFGLMVAFASPDGETIIKPYLDGIAWADLVHVQQSKFTVAELLSLLDQVNAAGQKTSIPFASGENFMTSKVTLYTAEPDELRRQLATQDAIKAHIDDIEFVYQEGFAEPATQRNVYLPTMKK